MKKIIILVMFLTAVGVTAASAQVVWGGRVGLCYATISAEGQKLAGKPSLEVGPVLYYSIKDNFYLNSGAMFSIKNFELELVLGDSGGTHTESESLNLYYIEVPVYVGYAFPIGGLDFYAQAGPFVGFKVGEKLPWEGGSGINSFNAGLGLAGGVNIKRFKIEVGYQQGLTNVFKSGEEGSASLEATLGSVFLGVSYVF
jgi:opacity protein-like surface antigen